MNETKDPGTSRALWYTGAPLDRLSHRRADDGWMNNKLYDPQSRIVAVWRDKSLVHNEKEGAFLPTVGETKELLDTGRFHSFLGVKEGIAYFGIDLSHHEDPYQAHPHIDNNGTFEDLRAVGPSLEQHEGSILAHARGLMFWHKRNGYCGVCGAETQPEKAGSQRRCTNMDCNTEHFPRTDPAVIMLVYKGDKCLLGRTRNFIPQMYSTLAGFVEPGESLEEAVAREVLEETAVIVDPAKVRYWASQPWPFPASLMLGFHAEADSEEIMVDQEELEDARWIHKSQLSHLEDFDMRLPRRDSIAYRLIVSWMNGEA